MAVPLSITVGILAIAGACSTSVRLLRSVHAAPQEMAHLERELQHLKDITKDVEALVIENGNTSNALIKNMEDARVKMQQVHDFIDKRLYRISSSSVPVKVRRRDLIRLERNCKHLLRKSVASRLVLPTASRSRLFKSLLTTLIVNMKLECTSDQVRCVHTSVRIARDRDGPQDGPPVSSQVMDPHHQDFELDGNLVRAQRALIEDSSVVAGEMNAFRHHETIQRTSDSSVSSSERTQQSMFSRDVSSHECLARIYHRLGDNYTQTQRLTQMSGTFVGTRRRPSHKVLRTERIGLENMDDADDTPSSDISVAVDSDGDDLSLDCVSHFSEDDVAGPMQRLRARFLARQSPDSFFEASSTFFPEQYTLDSRFIGAVAVLAVAEQHRTSTHRLQKYFLIYAEGPRAWRRVTVSATIISGSPYPALPQVVAPDVSQFYYESLPGDLESQLEGVLRNKQLPDTVSKVSLIIRGDIPGNLAIDASTVCIAEDFEETRMSNEEAMLQDIEDIGCPLFLQSEVVVRLRRYSSFFVVQVESRVCIEEEMPFVGTGLADDNGVKNWFEDLKYLSTLRGCNDVVNFIGVVLDDTRKHLKSYLYELPALGNIYRIFTSAEAIGDRIPWSLRETWAKQFVSAVSHVHAQNLVVGLLQLNSIGVRSDGSAVLTALRPLARRAPNRNSYLPPEIRTVPAYTPLHKIMNFRTDIFQPGLTLWLLAEHRSAVDGYFCLRNACTNMPRYSCQADHTNPVDLAPCISTDVPAFFDLIINHCRQADPTARMPARALLQYFPERNSPSGMADLAKKYPVNDCFVVNCDECRASTMNLHYHCNICYFSDFDLCAHCVSQGLHCFVPEHQLVKRVFRNGGVVDAL